MATSLDQMLALLDANDPVVEGIEPALVSVLRELLALERREREISSVRRRLHDRLASFANPSSEARERVLSAERRDLHERIDLLRARATQLLAAAG